MKKRILTLLLSLLMVSVFSQELNYSVQGRFTHAITKEKLSQAKSMADIIPYYPESWITSYVSAEVSKTHNGETLAVAGENDQMNAEQLELLSTAELGSDVVFTIDYKATDLSTNKLYDGQICYNVTLVPEIQAEFPDGYTQLASYLKENAIDKIPGASVESLELAEVSFTVDEAGGVARAQIRKTSGDPRIDELLLSAINKMPKWKPAEDAGKKVSQEFIFSVGNNVGC